jgi:ABC-type transport system substrate-binding protein
MKNQLLTYRSFVLLFAILLLLTACQPQATEAPATQEAQPTEAAGIATQPPVQVEAQPTQISADINLDPALAQDADSLMVSQYLYEGLVRLGADGEPHPALAESWVISDDQLDYIFTLRSNATFSDGTQITPDIVADNFNRWFDPESPLRGSGDYATWGRIFLGFHGEKGPDDRAKSSVDGIQKVDVNTVLIHLNRPVPDLLKYLADPAFAILNPTALSSGTYGGQGSTIISSGPYVVSSWTGAGLTLGPNPNYWGDKPASELKFTYK